MTRNGERGNRHFRFADRFVGIPAVALAGAFRRLMRPFTRSMRPPAGVIGLVKASGIGDAVILSGVIGDLRAAFPSATIVLFCGQSNYAFARLLDGLDEVVPLPVRRPFEALRQVRARRPDVVVDFGMWPRFEALIAVLSGARWIVGMRTPGQHRHFAYDDVVDHSTDHEIVNYRNLVARLGVRSTSLPGLRVGAERPRPFSDPYVVLHLWPGGANAAERSWPMERWFGLARSLDRRGYTVVLSGGPDDVQPARALIDEWDERSLYVYSIAGFRAEDTILWLRHARGVVSVNTGLMHLAAALGTPTVALNGPTSTRRWGPLGAHTRNVRSPLAPDGYLNLGWERDDRYADCMQAITEDAVLAAWDDLRAEVDASEMTYAASGASVRGGA